MATPRLLKFARLDDCNLQRNERHQAAARHALKIYQSNAIYSYIPKNACSTMRLSLAIANGCLADSSGIDWIHHNNATFRATLEDLIRAAYTFVILRDPFARLASCFLDKIVSQELPGPQLEDLLGRPVNLEAISFTDFVHMLDDPAVHAGNPHWRPQTQFLVYERYDDYFAVESFAKAVATIERRTGMAVIDARPLTAHGLDRFRLLSASDDHSKTSAGEIARLKSNGECPDPRSLYAPAMVEAVARLYDADLKLYTEATGLPTLFQNARPN